MKTRHIFQFAILTTIYTFSSDAYIWSAPPPSTTTTATLKPQQRPLPLPQDNANSNDDDDNNDDGYKWTPPPPISPATSLPNQIYKWKSNQNIRYQQAGDVTKPLVLLVHGLFSNSDHWRHVITNLASSSFSSGEEEDGDDGGGGDCCCVYAIDLWGCGYSSKIPSDSKDAQRINGERRFFGSREDENSHIVKGVTLGTDSGKERIAQELSLLHPCGTPYNFYTWAELISDFTKDVILSQQQQQHQQQNQQQGDNDKQEIKKVTIVGNSIGVTAALQSILDTPQYYNGLVMINPHFRPLHHAQLPFARITMPIVKAVQQSLRKYGHGLFDLLAKPWIVRHILQRPYANKDAIDNVLVDSLLQPLLTQGASDVIFDCLSYSAGPLIEQQLACMEHNRKDSGSSSSRDVPVWVCFGKKDPWASYNRIRYLERFENVKKVVEIENAGHCPMDETPEVVNSMILEFVKEIRDGMYIYEGEK